MTVIILMLRVCLNGYVDKTVVILIIANVMCDSFEVNQVMILCIYLY